MLNEREDDLLRAGPSKSLKASIFDQIQQAARNNPEIQQASEAFHETLERVLDLSGGRPCHLTQERYEVEMAEAQAEFGKAEIIYKGLLKKVGIDLDYMKKNPAVPQKILRSKPSSFPLEAPTLEISDPAHLQAGLAKNMTLSL